MLTVIGTVLGVLAGAVQGYFGGRTDLIGQRLIEIWSAMPELYLLIIFASIFEPSLLLLFMLLSLFGWLGCRTTCAPNSCATASQDYVRAARAMGLSNWQIMWRHVLPNSLTPVITFLPFRMSGGDSRADQPRFSRSRRAAADAEPRRTACARQERISTRGGSRCSTFGVLVVDVAAADLHGRRVAQCARHAHRRCCVRRPEAAQ